MDEVNEAQSDDLPKVTQLVNGRDETQMQVWLVHSSCCFRYISLTLEVQMK